MKTIHHISYGTIYEYEVVDYMIVRHSPLSRVIDAIYLYVADILPQDKEHNIALNLDEDKILTVLDYAFHVIVINKPSKKFIKNLKTTKKLYLK